MPINLHIDNGPGAKIVRKVPSASVSPNLSYVGKEELIYISPPGSESA
jgi:hypothetical protein